jgi:YidC/Oxa1 family membrane protein insertase
MDRNTFLRWILISGLIAFGYFVVIPMFKGHSGDAQPIPQETYANAPGYVGDWFDEPRRAKGQLAPEGELCTLQGNRFRAELSTRGAAVTHFWLTDPQYAADEKKGDLSTTPDHERWRSLRTLFRAAGADDQIKYDRFDWKLEKIGSTGCKFTYADDDVAIVKTVSVGDRPFEVNVDTQVTNLASTPRKHALSIATFAFRQNKDIKGKLGRVSPFVTDLQCARDKDVTRKAKDDFKEGWFREPLDDRYAAVSNYFFAQAIVPVDAKPECALLAEALAEDGKALDDDESGAVYHAVLQYAPAELQPKATADYKQIAFFGPKERDVLAVAAGGKPKLDDLINLGTFSIVAKIIVKALVWFHKPLGNWGLAIIALTLCLRVLVFPLSWKQIQTTVAMRKLKPEIDDLNRRFPDDAQARQMAMMELYRKHGVNPLGGCLPQLVQLPIWWAMYTSLQTAVEMYHEKFLWIQDLAAPDALFILPIVYGGFIVLQQRIVPQQGMDPMQQKMMTYMFPVLFTVLVLFLPAALGVYMLTSSALGILQQLVVEKIAPRNPPPGIVVKQVDDADAGKAAAFGKGKARV